MIESFVALGSNVNAPKEQILKAFSALSLLPKTELIQTSSLYQTQPWGKVNQDDFVNAVAKIKTSLSPQDLLTGLLEVEQQAGRVRQEKWGPRTLDCDLLFYGDEEIHASNLIVPHPLMHLRDFVLAPLAEIAPDKMLRGKPVKEWLKEIHLGKCHV
ncbi:MAG: 2-amino-4-hydroxy-6-hydroxymethyldihydropteridine diphosphokinase [Candidatus Berkiellales bacterium]